MCRVLRFIDLGWEDDGLVGGLEPLMKRAVAAAEQET